MTTYNRIHLCHSVPYGTTKRAKALCGAWLRDGHIYTTLMDHVYREVERLYTSWVYIRQRSQHTHYRVKDYYGNLCPDCANDPDTALALLAHTG